MNAQLIKEFSVTLNETKTYILMIMCATVSLTDSDKNLMGTYALTANLLSGPNPQPPTPTIASTPTPTITPSPTSQPTATLTPTQTIVATPTSTLPSTSPTPTPHDLLTPSISPSILPTQSPSLLSKGRYYNGKQGWSIIPPEGWIIERSATEVSFIANNYADQIAFFDIYCHNTNSDLSEYVSKELSYNYSSVITNYNLVSRNIVQIAGYSCELIEIKGT